MDKSWKKIDEMIKQELLVDEELDDFLKPVFPEAEERKKFIAACLKKLKARRMLLSAQWYTEIANDQDKVRHNRVALKIIFLMALAESVAKMAIGTNKLDSFKAIQVFFKHILPEDKLHITQTFQRASIGPKHHILRFSSIIRILYEVRNKAVHGEDYYSFSLFDKERKKLNKDYTHYSLMTAGQLGKRNKKRRVPVNTTLTYEELRDIIRRTAIENIKNFLV